jgi:hypothetical protein
LPAVKAEVFLSNALINLGWVHHWLGDVKAARAPPCRTTGRVLAAPSRRWLRSPSLQDPELAATLFGRPTASARSIGAGVWMTDRASHDQTAAQLQTQLGETAYAAATDRGRSLTVDEVLELTSG